MPPGTFPRGSSEAVGAKKEGKRTNETSQRREEGARNLQELQKNPQERRMEGRGGHKMTMERDGGERKRKRG